MHCTLTLKANVEFLKTLTGIGKNINSFIGKGRMVFETKDSDAAGIEASSLASYDLPVE